MKTDIGILHVKWGHVQRLLVKSMFRRTPRQGKCTCMPASVHLSNTTAKRKGIARSLLVVVREIAELSCVDIIGGDFNMAAFHERRTLGRIEDPCGLVFAHASRWSSRCGDGHFLVYTH